MEGFIVFGALLFKVVGIVVDAWSVGVLLSSCSVGRCLSVICKKRNLHDEIVH